MRQASGHTTAAAVLALLVFGAGCQTPVGNPYDAGERLEELIERWQHANTRLEKAKVKAAEADKALKAATARAEQAAAHVEVVKRELTELGAAYGQASAPTSEEGDVAKDARA